MSSIDRLNNFCGPAVNGKELWPATGQKLKEKDGMYTGGVGNTQNLYFKDIHINPKGELVLVPSRDITGKNTNVSNSFNIFAEDNYNGQKGQSVFVCLKGMVPDGAFADATNEQMRQLNEFLKKNPDSPIKEIKPTHADEILYLTLKNNARLKSVKEYRYPAKIGIEFEKNTK